MGLLMRPRNNRGGLLALLPFLALGALLSESEDGSASGALHPDVWVLGDSIGVGIEGALRRAGVLVRGDAINSTTAQFWAARLRDTALVWPTGRRFVVVSLGTNDAQTATLRKGFATAAASIVAELQKRGHVVCWVLPPSEASAVPSSTDLERLIGLGVVVLQERVPMGDTWHPTAAGYDHLAAVIEQNRRNAR